MQLSFHGAAGTVTGSRHLLQADGQRILVDAGLFQGLKQLRLRNWSNPGFDPASIDAVLLTHTHIDHAGFLPRLVKNGLKCPIHCTEATRELAQLLLMDSAKIQEEDARWANKKGHSRHKPALPLYDSDDVEKTLALLVEHPYETWIEVGHAVRARMLNAGHILGSAMIQTVMRDEADCDRTLLFSGDIGRYDMPLHVDPVPPPAHEILVIESTYGNRQHEHQPLGDQIIGPFTACFDRGGVVLVPAFAVGRAQQFTLVLRELIEAGRLPEIPIHIDSPMAIDATRIYSRHLRDQNLDADLGDGGSRLFPKNVHYHRTVDESKALNEMRGPRVIISSSGMMVGGRILHHLARRLPDPKNLVCLVGYQAAGTRGRKMLEGARYIRIHGYDVERRAEMLVVHGMSGHADRDELLRWVASAPEPPETIFVTHGEPDSSAALAAALIEQTGAKVHVPEHGQSFDLGARPCRPL